MKYAALICAMTALALPAMAQPAAPAPAQVMIASTQRLAFTSHITGTNYVLYVRLPMTPPPPKGYPVVYVLDGDMFFDTAAETALRRGVFGMAEPVIVGIGYGAFDDPQVARRHAKLPPSAPVTAREMGMAFNDLRSHDLALPTDPQNREPAWLGITPADMGGADDFLKVIETEIKPRIDALAPIDKSRQALFGHSLGGLAALEALFTEPNAFQTFLIASPPIYYNAGSIRKKQPAFDKAVQSGAASPRVLLMAGGDEPDHSAPVPPPLWNSLSPEHKKELAAYIARVDSWGGMLTNVRALAAALGSLHGKPGYTLSLAIFNDEGHADVPPTALNRGMHFALDMP